MEFHFTQANYTICGFHFRIAKRMLTISPRKGPRPMTWLVIAASDARLFKSLLLFCCILHFTAHPILIIYFI